jgi:transcriptional regulator with XRE-family HTH domain
MSRFRTLTPRTPPRKGALGSAIRNAYVSQFTQGELARQLKVGQNTVSRWSTGDVEPSLTDIFMIECICGLTTGHILREAGYVADLLTPEKWITEDHRFNLPNRKR